MRLLWSYRRPLRVLAAHELMLMLAALIVCLVRGRFTLSIFGSNLAGVGLLWFGFAVTAVYGAWGSTRSFNYQFASSSSQSIMERFNDNQRDMRQAFTFFANCFISGMVAMVMGVALFFF